METIKCAAIQFDGEIFTARRHHQIFSLYWRDRLNNGEQGFIAINGKSTRFVSRKDAYVIAKNANQLLDPSQERDYLLSEDIY